MFSTRTLPLACTFLALAFLSSAVAHAQQGAGTPDAKEILAKCDKNLGGYDDQYMLYTMTIVDVNGAKKEYESETTQKGDKKRLVRFTTGEIKGMATLIEDRNNMHVYLPGFKKIRRVAAHAMNQSFAGSDFSNDDMASVTWGAIYTPVFDHEDADNYFLKLTPKPGERISYAWVILKVDKKTFMQSGVDYFNEKGEQVKYQKNWDLFTYPSGSKLNRQLEIGDPRTGHKTLLFIKEFKVNQDVKEDFFSTRQLQWGN